MKKKKKKIGKINPIIYHIGALYCRINYFLKGIRINIDKSGVKDLKGPCLVLAPHTSGQDHILVSLALYPHRPTYVVSEHFVLKPFIRFVMTKIAKVITKKMFCPDPSTIFGILRAKNENAVIVLFPEGRLNSAPYSHPVTSGTAELVKKMGVNVYTVTCNGATLAFPKWGEKFRKGKINIETAKLFDGEVAKNLSVEEISLALDKAIYHDDEKAMQGEIYKCKCTASGLENVLYKCPECGKEFEIYTSVNEIFCNHCGFKTALGEDYKLSNGKISTVGDWFRYQTEALDLNEVLEADIKIGSADEKGNMCLEAGEGRIKADKETFSLKGEVFGEEIEFSVNTASIGGTPYTPGSNFDIYHNKKLLYLMPNDRKTISKWVTFVDKVVAQSKSEE